MEGLYNIHKTCFTLFDSPSPLYNKNPKLPQSKQSFIKPTQNHLHIQLIISYIICIDLIPTQNHLQHSSNPLQTSSLAPRVSKHSHRPTASTGPRTTPVWRCTTRPYRAGYRYASRSCYRSCPARGRSSQTVLRRRRRFRPFCRSLTC